MRRFSSYGPVDTHEHYYVSRGALVEKAYTQLKGTNPDRGGRYFTVWAPRQTGKTWLMQQILFKLQKEPRFDVLKINLEHLKEQENVAVIIETIAEEIGEGLGKDFTGIQSKIKFQNLFKKGVLDKPLILILDEFDALGEKGISAVVSAFRNIHIKRMDESDKPTEQKTYLLHGVALIGVRSVLGIENVKGSPFNVQRSLPVPNLTENEVKEMFRWYEKESGQNIHPEVIDKLYYETRGQPGLTSWFGELLTETYNEKKVSPIDMDNFQRVYTAATRLLPNVNVLNIISKAKQEPYKNVVLDLFRTDDVTDFSFDDKNINFLYMNGVIEPEEVSNTEIVVRFANPFLQKRLFNYFSNELFDDMGKLVEPFDKLEDSITETSLDIRSIMKHYQEYLVRNRTWLLKDVPRRKDLRIYEAVFHFNLYMYLFLLLKRKGGRVHPEFPTGNGKIDIVIEYKNVTYGLELKSYTDHGGYKKALSQAASYGKKLGLKEISLIFFIESIDEENRKKYEKNTPDKNSGVHVAAIFIETQHAAAPILTTPHAGGPA